MELPNNVIYLPHMKPRGTWPKALISIQLPTKLIEIPIKQKEKLVQGKLQVWANTLKVWELLYVVAWFTLCGMKIPPSIPNNPINSR